MGQFKGVKSMAVSKSIINYIDSNLKEYDNDTELAYMIYVLLNKILCYSPDYAFSRDESKLPNIEDITIDNPYVNCHTWSQLYKQVLNYYGIEASVLTDKDNLHSCVLLTVDGVQIKADGTKIYMGTGIRYTSDLCNYKFNLPSVSFHLAQSTGYKKDSWSKLLRLKDKVNEKLGVTNEEKMLEEYLNQGREMGLDSEERVCLGIGLLNNVYDMFNGGNIEKRQILDKYYGEIFGNDYLDGYKYLSLFSIENNMRVPHRLLYFNFGDEIVLALEETNSFRLISFDEVFDMLGDNKLFFKYDKESILFSNMFISKNKVLKKVI